MSAYKWYAYVMTPAVFLSFSLNTWLFLEQSRTLSSEYRRQMSWTIPSNGQHSVMNRDTETGGIRTLVRAPPGVKQVISGETEEGLFSYCQHLLAKGTANKGRGHRQTDGHEPSDHKQSANRAFDLDRPKQRLKAVKLQRVKSNVSNLTESKGPEILKHSIVLRTDDNRTTQTTPWGGLPDECSSKDYGSVNNLPTVSVIICFHEQEQIADVLHTVHSVIQRSPRQLIREILLVDDYSKKEDFKQILEKYVSAVFSDQNIRIIRSERHMGLIQCRLHGAKMAQGDVLYFMDSHMEVQPKWLEPLLFEIKQNPRTLASSYLDWMKQDSYGNWSYTYGSSSWKTYFDWDFVFGFQSTSQQAKSFDLSSPVSCPVTVGGVFAISRAFFFDIGAFDDGMWGWGGENLDLPIRVWLFGGRVVNVPCSHVGHLETMNGRSYRLTWQQKTNVNYKRVTETWMSGYEKYVYYYKPAIKAVDSGNLTSRLKLRNKTSRTFGWILENVYPELGFYDKDTFAWDGLRNLHFNTCLGAITPHTHPFLSQCNKSDTLRQGFFLNELGELRFPVHVFNTYSDQLRIYEYIEHYKTGSASRWIHWPGGPMQLYSSNQCLEATDQYTVRVMACDRKKRSQRWQFNTYSDKLYDILRTKPVKKDNYYWYSLYMEHIQTEGNVTRVL